MEVKLLKFDKKWERPILSGRKRATVRLPETADRYIPGDVARLYNVDLSFVFASSIVEAVIYCKAGDAMDWLRAMDIPYPLDNTAELVEGLNRYYDRDITRESPVGIITFGNLTPEEEME